MGSSTATTTAQVPGINIEGIFYFIYHVITGGYGTAVNPEFHETLLFWWDAYSILAYILSAVLAVIVVYATVRINQIEEMEQHDIHMAEMNHVQKMSQKNSRWMQIQDHAVSLNPNDWKVAIIEADIMLDELLDKQGYTGASIGDKLKQVPSGGFASLNDAWEAHRVRNAIAHEGADFVLTQRTTKETIEQYRRVFAEFDLI